MNKNIFINKYIEYDKKWNPNYIEELNANNNSAFYRIDDLIKKHPDLIIFELVDEFEALKKDFSTFEYEKIKERSNELNKLISCFVDYMIFIR